MARKDEKTTQIITAATEEFLERGFESASMHNIAERAQVSKRTLYKYFPNKEELYSALIDEALEQIKDMYDFKFSHELSIKNQIEKIVDKKMELTLSDSFLKLSRIVIAELIKGRRPSEEQQQKINNSDLLFFQWLEEAKKAGEIKSKLTLETIANQFHSILKGQIFWPLLMGMIKKEELNLKEIRKECVDFFLQSFCK